MKVVKSIIETLYEALKDYSIDNRGDIGSWVREQAMTTLEWIIHKLYSTLEKDK